MGFRRFHFAVLAVCACAVVCERHARCCASGPIIERLPATDTTLPVGGAAEQVVFEDYRLESPVEVDFDAPVQRHKNGFFQKAQFSGGWVGSGSERDLGMSYVSTSVTGAIPLGSFDNILAVTPSFRVDYVDGPLTPDVPEQLYVTGVNFFWRRSFTERWGVTAMATPSVRSDFRTGDDAVRVFGLLLADLVWWPEELVISFGAVYLDRDDLSVLPAAGLKWTPSPVWTFDLMFPRPKIAHRIAKDGPCSETWAYVVGGLGGNTWAVKRVNGTSDSLTISDYRVSLGVERITHGGGGQRVEVGYAFGRQVEYASSEAEFDFGDALVVEAGVAF